MKEIMKLGLKSKKVRKISTKEGGYEPIQVIAAVGLGVIVLGSLLFYFGKGMNVFRTAKDTEIGNGQTASEILDDPASIINGDN